jgi:hypothetical protein
MYCDCSCSQTVSQTCSVGGQVRGASGCSIKGHPDSTEEGRPGIRAAALRLHQCRVCCSSANKVPSASGAVAELHGIRVSHASALPARATTWWHISGTIVLEYKDCGLELLRRTNAEPISTRCSRPCAQHRDQQPGQARRTCAAMKLIVPALALSIACCHP